MELSHKHLLMYVGIIVLFVLISLYFYCRKDTRQLFPAYLYEHFNTNRDILTQLKGVSSFQHLSDGELIKIITLIDAVKGGDERIIHRSISDIVFFPRVIDADIPKLTTILRTFPEFKTVDENSVSTAILMARTLFKENPKQIHVVDNFGVLSSNKITTGEDKSNYITNGSFADGRHIEQRVLSEGNNDIVVFPNPGKSSYVLRQSSKYRKNTLTNKDEFQKTFYQIQIKNLLPERSYYIRSFVYQSPDWNGKDYVFNVMMNPAESTFLGDQVILSGDGTIISNSVPIEGRVWNLVEYNFTTPKNFDGTAQIYVGFNPDNTSGYRYVTDLIFRQYLEFARNFPVSNKLQLFLSGSNPNSYYGVGTSWKDLSGSGNDMQFNQKPKWDPKSGQFSLEGYQGTGARGFRLLNPPLSKSIDEPTHIRSIGNSFTLMIDPMRQKLNHETQVESQHGANVTGGTSANMEIISEYGQILKLAANPEKVVLKDSDRILFFIRGNQNVALAVIWPNNTDFLKVIIGDQLFQTQHVINTELPLVYTFQYDGNGLFKIFQDSSLIFDHQCPRLYFNNDEIELNSTRLFTGLLRNIILFNRALNLREIDDVIQYIRDHTIVESDVLDIRPNISNYMVSVPTNLPPGLNNITSKSSSLNSSTIIGSSSSPTAIGSNGMSAGDINKDINSKEISSLLQKIIEKETEIRRKTDLIMNREENRNLSGSNMKEKQDTIEQSIRKQMMDDPQIKLIQQRIDELKNLQSCDTSLGPSCPRVYQTNGHFLINAPAGSRAAQKFGRTGVINLGVNRNSALHVYKFNFPECIKMPEILNIEIPTPAGDSCPFLIMSERNPCRTGACVGVNWAVPPNTQILSDNCNKSIRHYCEMHGNIEGSKGQACYCWGDGKSTSNCREYRNQFSGNTCDFNNQSIDRHPDSKKYIRRNLVSSVCANCPLDSYQTAPDPRNNNIITKGVSILKNAGIIS